MTNENIANVPGTADTPPPQALTSQPVESENSPVLLLNQKPVPAGRGSEIKNQQSSDEDDTPIDAAQVLDQASQFLGRYLECPEHQRTIMALWVLHTHLLSGADVTPYLAIQSTEKQSGKTLCLKLLSMLISHKALTAGFTAVTLGRRLDPSISPVLLDECHSTVGTLSRPKNPLLRSLLACGYHSGIGYTDATHERHLFAPKAFAGKGQLPEEIADRSISIVLKPASDSSPVERFRGLSARKEAEPLRQLLHSWADGAEEDWLERSAYRKEDFPPNLSPRRRDMVEPLMQLADFIGGEWPRRIREAIPVVFAEQADFALQESLQLLADIRDCLAFHNYPERIATAVVLEWLHGLTSRPWDINGNMTPQKFARLLAPFQIKPRLQRMGKDSSARGYQLDDFFPHWQKHLGFDPASITRARESEIASKNAGCNTVTDGGRASEISANQRKSAANDSAVDVGVEVSQDLKANSQEPDSWLPSILPPLLSAFYNFGPHSDYDVKIIRHFGAQGYKALSAAEANRMEFSCGNIPFAPVNPRTSLDYPPKPVRSVKQEERSAKKSG